MSFTESIRTVLSRYADFNGRASRSEFWWWALALFGAYIICVILFVAAHVIGDLLYVLLALGTLLPNLGVAVRRLHDSGRSGWWLLIGFVPLVGGIVLLVFYCLDSTPGPNSYGSGPRGPVEGTARSAVAG